MYIVVVASATTLSVLKDLFFRDSASCCSCCVRVVVAAHYYQNRDSFNFVFNCCQRQLPICVRQVVKCNFYEQIF